MGIKHISFSSRYSINQTMKRIIRFVHTVDQINMWTAKVTGFLVIAIATVLLSGVVMRYIFHRALAWEGDIAWLFFIFYVVMAGAYVLRKGDHVRVDVIYFRFDPKRKAILDAATFVLFLLFMVVLTWFSIRKAWWSVSILEKSSHSTFHAPIYPARIAMALGCLSLLFQGVAEFIGNIMAIRGDKIDGRVK